MKRIWAIIALAIIILTLAGCGRKTEEAKANPEIETETVLTETILTETVTWENVEIESWD